jgi:hypothetical protein
MVPEHIVQTPRFARRLGVAPGLALGSGLALGIGLASPALAYETDQLTGRDVPLRDASAWANAHMDQLLDDAAARVNTATRCEGSDAAMRRALATRIHAEAARAARVKGRGFMPGLGHSRYSAALEQAPIDRIYAPDGIYADVGLRGAPALATAGVCSTINIGDVRVGTDKFFHFLDEGYVYFRRSDEGAAPERGVAWGTRSEKTITGLWTSGAFSYADLRANWDGYRFYTGLLQEGSVLQRGEDGCIERVAAWDWRDWVDPEYDELLNPSVYRKPVQRAVSARLEAQRDTVCSGLAGELPAPILDPPPYAGRKAPPRTDPFALDTICEDDVAAGDAISEAEEEPLDDVRREARRLKRELRERLPVLRR